MGILCIRENIMSRPRSSAITIRRYLAAVLVGVFAAALVTPALADGWHRGWHHGWHHERGDDDGTVGVYVAAPPVATYGPPAYYYRPAPPPPPPPAYYVPVPVSPPPLFNIMLPLHF